MIKFMILFQQPTDPDTFENVYQDFLALIERMPNILRRQVVHVTGSPQGTPQYYRILELYFESPATQQEALLSSIGQEAGKELGRLPQGTYDLLFADVYEEDGGSTPTEDDTPAQDAPTEDTPAQDEPVEDISDADEPDSTPDASNDTLDEDNT